MFEKGKQVPVTAGTLISAGFALTSDPATLLLRLTDSNGATFDCTVDGPRLGMLFGAIFVRTGQLQRDAMNGCSVTVNLAECTSAGFDLQLDPTQQECAVRIGTGPLQMTFLLPTETFVHAAAGLKTTMEAGPTGSSH